jgi:hypothetical protein
MVVFKLMIVGESLFCCALDTAFSIASKSLIVSKALIKETHSSPFSTWRTFQPYDLNRISTSSVNEQLVSPSMVIWLSS